MQYVTSTWRGSVKTTWSYGTLQLAGLYLSVVLSSEQRTDNTDLLSGQVTM